MRIETSSIKSNVLYSAFLTQAVVIVAVPACVICVLFYIGSKTRRVSNVSNDLFDPAKLNFDLIGFSIFGIILSFLLVYMRNARKKMVVAVEFDDSNKQATLEYKTFYVNRI